MKLKDFLKLDKSGKYLVIWLCYDDDFIDQYYKHELENNVYANIEVGSFRIGDNELYINLVGEEPFIYYR